MKTRVGSGRNSGTQGICWSTINRMSIYELLRCIAYCHFFFYLSMDFQCESRFGLLVSQLLNSAVIGKW